MTLAGGGPTTRRVRNPAGYPLQAGSRGVAVTGCRKRPCAFGFRRYAVWRASHYHHHQRDTGDNAEPAPAREFGEVDDRRERTKSQGRSVRPPRCRMRRSRRPWRIVRTLVRVAAERIREFHAANPDDDNRVRPTKPPSSAASGTLGGLGRIGCSTVRWRRGSVGTA